MNKIWKGKGKKIVPLIVMFTLICVIAIVCVWVSFGRPSEIAEIGGDKNAETEQILATTVQAGETYTVPKTETYKIELYGGKGKDRDLKGSNGSKVTGYIRLVEGTILTVENYSGGKNVSYEVVGGAGVGLYVGDNLMAVAGGGRAGALVGERDKIECMDCNRIIYESEEMYQEDLYEIPLPNNVGSGNKDELIMMGLGVVFQKPELGKVFVLPNEFRCSNCRGLLFMRNYREDIYKGAGGGGTPGGQAGYGGGSFVDRLFYFDANLTIPATYDNSVVLRR